MNNTRSLRITFSFFFGILFICGCTPKVPDYCRMRDRNAMYDMCVINQNVPKTSIPLDLSDIIQIALCQNLDIKLQEIERCVYDKNYVAEKLRQLPELTAHAEYSERDNTPAWFSRSLGGPVGLLPTQSSDKTVKSNITGARWVLYDDQEKVQLGSGTQSDLQVAEGDRYKLRVEEFEGYKVHLEPSETFSLHDEKTKEIKIIYERETGQVELSAWLPAGKIVSLKLIPEKNEKNLISVRLESKTGMVFWTSPPLPTGTYTVRYKTTENYLKIRPRKIKVIPDQTIHLSPEFVQSRKLTVTSNNPNAIYHLRKENNDKVLKAQGRSFTFIGLPPGKYILSFSNKYPHRVISPKDMEILITKHRNSQVKGNYRWD